MGNGREFYVELTNKRFDLAKSGDGQELGDWDRAVHYGAGRAPLELIAHVAETDTPYTEILTADYVMANPMAAEAYGATTEFEDQTDIHEFRPSKIARYYRTDDSKIVDEHPDYGYRIVEPGDLATDYPHSGILNTHAFLNRYPTTATNRNRARSRWTYYHFLGFDIEKSESRTMDPAVLKDTNNPTMLNPACTACHERMDPVAGAFQNYNDEGYYRGQWGGLDSLDDFYRNRPAGGKDVTVDAASWKDRQTLSAEGWLVAGPNK